MSIFLDFACPAFRRGNEENGESDALRSRLLVAALLLVTRLDFAALVWKEDDMAAGTGNSDADEVKVGGLCC